MRTEVDYDFVVADRAQGLHARGDAGSRAYMAKGVADGKIDSTSKNRSKVPPVFIGMHNDLAVRTL